LAFRVDITEAALADAEDFVEYVRREKRDPAGAERWWNGLLEALQSRKVHTREPAMKPPSKHPRL
jgi:plasmid stabilization system protein ParE